MPQNRFAVILLFAWILTGSLVGTATTSEPGQARVLIGPNILVSRDADVAHVEVMVAVNPTKSEQLVAGVITATRPAGGWACKAYTSADGGNTWIDSTFPEQVESGGGDPQVAFTADGTALFAALSRMKDEQGRKRSGLFVYRSEDGGRTWSKPVIAAIGADHPQIVVDHTNGKHHGRIYIGYLHRYPEYQTSIVHSDDGGHTFSKPVLAASGKGVIGINVTSIHLLGDGTLIVPYSDFDFHQTPTPPSEATSHIFFVSSKDGGETFSEPKVIGTQYAKLQRHLLTFSMFTAHVSAGKYHDRMYAVWTDYTTGEGRVVFTYSADKGITWKKPVVLDSSGAPGSEQYEAQIAVNNTGVVAVTWFDTRTNDLGHYDEYFTASLDGGESFVKPVRVSSRTSEMFGIGNMQIVPSTWQYHDVQRVSFISPATRWRAAGDYMGLTADSHGVFHPVWSDSRSGTFQVWTASVQVTTAAERAPVAPADIRLTDITKEVDIVIDPARYDPSSHVLEMPLRLQNRSGKTIYGPITATVVKFGSGRGEVWRDFAPEILNAVNHKAGTGAEMDYTGALGDLHELAPGALTDAVVWRLRIGNAEKIPDMHLSIKATIQ